jgi:glutamyl-Q tRNA(Asp) synthetase
VGDFILRRRDGLWAYQLAVVVDDGEQGITQVVRGEDLFDNTPRQCLLQAALGLPRPGYLHVPLVRDEAGRKLSKHDQAPALGQQPAIRELDLVWQQLGFAPLGADTPAAFLKQAEALWAERYALSGSRKRCA